MKLRMVNDEIWVTQSFTSLKKEAQLLYLYYLTNPWVKLSATYYIPEPTITYELGYSSAEIATYNAELVQAGLLIVCDRFIHVPNMIIWNRFAGYPVLKGAANEINALPQEVFVAIYHQSPPFKRLCDLIKAKDIKIDLKIEPWVAPEPETKPELKLNPEKKETKVKETEQIRKLKDHAKELLKDSKRKPELSNEQYQKLIDRHGMELMFELQKVFYSWKSQAKEVKSTDFGVLNNSGSWAHKRVMESGYRERVERETAWTLPFEKPKNWDNWSIEEKRSCIEAHKQRQAAHNKKVMKEEETRPVEEVLNIDPKLLDKVVENFTNELADKVLASIGFASAAFTAVNGVYSEGQKRAIAAWGLHKKIIKPNGGNK